MNHALVLNSSERPCEDGKVEGIIAAGQVGGVGADEMHMGCKIGRPIDPGDPQIIGLKINTERLLGVGGIAPSQAPIAAADLQDAHWLRIEASVTAQVFDFRSFRINLDCH
jgi:hypothetical protein